MEWSTDEEVLGTPPPPGYEKVPKESDEGPLQAPKEHLRKRAELDKERHSRWSTPIVPIDENRGPKHLYVRNDNEIEYINDGDVSEIEEKDPNSRENSDSEEEKEYSLAEQKAFSKDFNHSMQQVYAEVLG